MKVEELVSLLAEARRLNNQTLLNADEVAAWHRQVDAALASAGDPDPSQRYDDPERAERRRWLKSVFDS